MKLKFFKKYSLFFSIPLLFLPTIFLTSCSNNQISQFGNYVTISTPNISPYSSHSYKYDPVSGSFLKDDAVSNATSDKEFSPFFSFIEQNRLFVDKLVSLAHADPKSSDSFFLTDSKNYSNQIISPTDAIKASKPNLLHEFLLASSNNLNQGSQNYKLAVSNIVATPTSSPYNLIPSKTTDVLKIDDKNSLELAYFNDEITNVVNISMTFSFYDASINDLYRSPITDINFLNNYLVNNKSWGPNSGAEGFRITQPSYTISFNLESYIRSVYKLKTPVTAGTTTINFDSNNMDFNTLQFCFKANTLLPQGEFLQKFPAPTSSFINQYSPSSTSSDFATYYQQLTKPLSQVDLTSQLSKFQNTLTLVK